MRDRQYVSSLASFAAAVTVLLAGIVSLPLWLGWGGAVGIVAVAGGFLAWFYWGPRPDLNPRGQGKESGRPSDD